MKHLFTAICIGSFLSFGVSLPLAAQINGPIGAPDPDTDTNTGTSGIGDDTLGLPEDAIAPDDAIDTETGGSDVGDDTLGLPEGADANRGLPDTGVVAPQGLIRLEINGVSQYYAPVNIDETQLDNASVPTYSLDSSDSDSLVNDAAVTGETSGPLEGNTYEPERDSLIIYPPADSIEDLEPEDILE